MRDRRESEVDHGHPDTPICEVLQSEEVKLLELPNTVVDVYHPVKERNHCSKEEEASCLAVDYMTTVLIYMAILCGTTISCVLSLASALLDTATAACSGSSRAQLEAVSYFAVSQKWSTTPNPFIVASTQRLLGKSLFI